MVWIGLFLVWIWAFEVKYVHCNYVFVDKTPKERLLHKNVVMFLDVALIPAIMQAT